MNKLWTYAADIKKIVSGLREMIESGHLSLRWQFSSQRAGKGLVPPGSASWKFAQEYKNVKFLTDEWLRSSKNFILITPRHDAYAYIMLSAVIIQLFEIVVGNKGVNRKPIERCVMVIVK